MGTSWGRLIFPLLWVPFLTARTWRERLALTGAVGLVFVGAFSGFALHPAARSQPHVLGVALGTTVVVAGLYTLYKLWGVWLLPLPGLPPGIRVSVWMALALLLEWALETFRVPVGVPVYFLTDAAGLFPVSILTRVWGAWAGVWLWGWGLVLVGSWKDPVLRWVRWVGLGTVGAAAVGGMLGHFPEVAQVPGHRLVLISPGIPYDAPYEVYEARYQAILSHLPVVEGETLWLVFPEGTFQSAPVDSTRWEKIREFWEAWRRRWVSSPVGTVWHLSIPVAPGEVRSRIRVEVPSGIVWTYDKRVPFIGGEKYVPLVSRWMGSVREAGDPHQPGWVLPSPTWSFHLLICNEGLMLTLVRPSPPERGMILVPAQFGWTYAPLFLQAIALRHRALVVHTGLPLCTIQREGGLACYLPGWSRPRVVGEPWARGPGLVELPLWVGRWNPAASRGGWALWGWVVGSVVLMMVGVYTGRGMRSRTSSRT